MIRVADAARVRRVKRDGEYVWQFRCPGCEKWGTIDDDQLRGRVSIHHDAPECGFHETLDMSGDPLVQQHDEFDYIKDATRGR